jgi:hypothetical protein
MTSSRRLSPWQCHGPLDHDFGHRHRRLKFRARVGRSPQSKATSHNPPAIAQANKGPTVCVNRCSSASMRALLDHGRSLLDRFPELEPYQGGIVNVGNGQHLYWEACGNPAGKPALVLYEGPGSGCRAGHRRYFNPGAYHVVPFDQRGAGRSTPRVGGTTDLSTNTTDHLVADIERMREHLGIGRWLVSGVSSGVTLGLA